MNLETIEKAVRHLGDVGWSALAYLQHREVAFLASIDPAVFTGLLFATAALFAIGANEVRLARRSTSRSHEFQLCRATCRGGAEAAGFRAIDHISVSETAIAFAWQLKRLPQNNSRRRLPKLARMRYWPAWPTFSVYREGLYEIALIAPSDPSRAEQADAEEFFLRLFG